MAFRKIKMTNVESTDTTLTDPLIILNQHSTSDVDLGFLSRRGPNAYAGLVRDSATSKFYLIDSIALNTQTIDDISAIDGTLLQGDLQVKGIEIQTTFVLPKGVTGERPTSPVEGQMFFNTQTKMFEGWDGTEWKQLVPSQFTTT
tara:strand:- start:46 stop:480 length:435 start_codon:yes stop_codon:yes gene_type:complete